jgi:formate C-acetyltransferase
MKKTKIQSPLPIDVRSFVQKNYKPYTGDDSFLAKPTKKTLAVWEKVKKLLLEEQKKGGVLDVDPKHISTITSHAPGYIDSKNESIVGLQTDAPLKRAIKPRGGWRVVEQACKAYGYELDPMVQEIYTKYATSFNDGVFSIYKYWEGFHTADGELFRKKGILTGLPDNYARGRIIGDTRRIALYGVDRLIEDKKEFLASYPEIMDASHLQLREEISWQIKALEDLKTMAAGYGFDIGKPATNVKEAIQWIYFGYLGTVKEQDGAAMSIGRLDTFIDIYAERDLQAKRFSESEIQQFIDDFIIKLRIVRHLRPPEYNELFAGDPTWVTLAMGGMGQDGRPLVTKTSFRLLHSLYNLGPAPEPNLTVLWSHKLPESYKKYVSRVAIDTCALQFENDDLMRPLYEDDYGIACCVSAMKMGKQMQYFGARCNLPKALLLAINQGKDEIDDSWVVKDIPKLKNHTVLDYHEVKKEFYKLLDWLAQKYVETMNVIHYMHDKYYYENLEMALHDHHVYRFMAFGASGISIVADSLSAIKYARVKAIRDKSGVAKSFEITGDFPKYGNDDDRVDKIAIEVVKTFISKLKKYKLYRANEHTLSLLTITSNVMYGKHTGATPDGREAFTPFAPGANPMHGRDTNGAIASLNSVAKIPYAYCRDGISNTFSVVPNTLGKTADEKVNNLKGLLDGYFQKGGFHLNVNVLHRETLEDAMKHPEQYPQLTIRISGYAVHFTKLTKEQQLEVISRTFHEKM